MNTFSLVSRSHIARWYLVFAVVLSGCAVEGGVPEATSPSATEQVVQPTDSAVAEQLAQRDTTWKIGLLDRPSNLYPYQSAAEQRRAAPILEVLFPSPILSYNYGYTTTGVLKQVPTLENGGAEMRSAKAYLDAAGNITTTVTQVVTDVNQLVVTYSWNPDLRWSDGTPVTAADSVFAYQLAKAAPPSDEALDKLDQTLEYTAVDDHTTRAVLKPDLIGTTYFLNVWTPLPQHLLASIPAEDIRKSSFARSPIGYGPYVLEGQDAEGNLQLKRNQYFFGSQPAAEFLSFVFQNNSALLRASIQNDNLDAAVLTRLQPEEYATINRESQDGSFNVTYYQSPIWEHIDFNLDVGTLQNYKIRQAIAYGTNRQGMIDTIFGGRSSVLESWVLPNQPEAAPLDQITRYGYDTARANALLDEAGLVDSDGDGIRDATDGISLTLQLLTVANDPLRGAIAEQFQKDMRAIGINIIVATLPFADMTSQNGPLRQRQFELALFGWAATPTAGGLSLWSCNAVPSERNGWIGENFTGWCFRDADIAIRTGTTTMDLAQRREAYTRQQQLWTQEVPSLPLFQRVSTLLADPNVRGLQPDTFAPLTWNIAYWQRVK